MLVAAEGRCGTGRVGSYPIRRECSLSGSTKRCDVAFWLLRRRRRTEGRPLLHEPAPLLEQVPAPVGLLDFIAYGVG